MSLAEKIIHRHLRTLEIIGKNGIDGIWQIGEIVIYLHDRRLSCADRADRIGFGLTNEQDASQAHLIEKGGQEGQRQRVAIARALAVRAEVLLADEPVSMLNVSIRLDILNLLLRLKNEEKLALLFITHDIASARYFAEDTLVMYAGQMVEGGPSEEIIQRPRHPYTQLLLSAAPDPDRSASDGKTMATFTARGEIPSLITPPSGCRFHQRCPSALPVYSQRFPSRTDLGGGHWTHCFLYSDQAER